MDTGHISIVPIVDCPACGRETFVLFRGLGERRCQGCGQTFWTTLSPGKAEISHQMEPPPGQSQTPGRAGTSRLERAHDDSRL